LGAPEGTEDGDRLEVLVTLVELYEAKRWPVETESFNPIDVLRYSIEKFGHTQAELGELLGSRSRASEILSRRRALTVDMIRKISDAWKIPADLLVRPYHSRTSCLSSASEPRRKAFIAKLSPRDCGLPNPRQLIEQHLGVLQIGSVEALSEPAVNGPEQILRFDPLFAPQLGFVGLGANERVESAFLMMRRAEKAQRRVRIALDAL
jgi:HTH-type transcriptional regulator / antitoxin HigA